MYQRSSKPPSWNEGDLLPREGEGCRKGKEGERGEGRGEKKEGRVREEKGVEGTPYVSLNFP